MASDGSEFDTDTSCSGGTAGNAVAARLSQYLEDCSVLVIEAGPAAYDEERINIPGKKGSTLGTK